MEQKLSIVSIVSKVSIVSIVSMVSIFSMVSIVSIVSIVSLVSIVSKVSIVTKVSINCVVSITLPWLIHRGQPEKENQEPDSSSLQPSLPTAPDFLLEMAFVTFYFAPPKIQRANDFHQNTLDF